MYGLSLLGGLKVTLRALFSKKETVSYPTERRRLYPRVRGSLLIDGPRCIGCGLCVRTCPNGVLRIKTAGKGKQRRLLRYEFDVEYCLFCGFCVDVCPTKALRLVQTSIRPSYDRYGTFVLYEETEEGRPDE